MRCCIAASSNLTDVALCLTNASANSSSRLVGTEVLSSSDVRFSGKLSCHCSRSHTAAAGRGQANHSAGRSYGRYLFKRAASAPGLTTWLQRDAGRAAGTFGRARARLAIGQWLTSRSRCDGRSKGAPAQGCRLIPMAHRDVVTMVARCANETRQCRSLSRVTQSDSLI